MTYSINDKVFNGNQFFEGNQDTQPRLDELRAIQERTARGDDIIVGDKSARDIVEFIVKRAGFLGHRLIGDLIDVWAEALMRHVDEVADGNPLAYVNPNWDHPARVRDPQFRAADFYKDMQPEEVDLKDDGSLYPDGYRKPVTDEKVAAAKKRLDELKAEQAAGNKAPVGRTETPMGQDDVSWGPSTENSGRNQDPLTSSDDEIRRIMGE